MARVVVAGGGLGGVASAARLAKQGHDVTLLERADRLGGAIGFVEQDGFRWDTGPAATALPAVLRDLFRKSGRPLERELDLVPLEVAREHRFEDGSAVALPTGGRGVQRDALEAGLGAGAGDAWLRWTHAHADVWDRVRRHYLEHPFSPEHGDREALALLTARTSLRRSARRTLRDPRLRGMALLPALLEGHDPRDVPAWTGMWDYVEQNFGVWTVPGGMGAFADLFAKRLRERRVDVRLGNAARDVVTTDGRARAVRTDDGDVPADVVVCAVDPRRLPALAALVRRTTPAIPPVVTHLGLAGDLPDLPAEVVWHGDPTFVLRSGGTAPAGEAAWTLLTRGRLSEDPVVALARRGLDLRPFVRTRLDRSPRDLVEAFGGSPYGLRWQGPVTVRRRPGPRTTVEGLYCAGAHATPGAGVPLVALGAAQVAAAVGPA